MMPAMRGLAVVLGASVAVLSTAGPAAGDGLPTFEIAGKTGYLSSPLNTLGLGGRLGYSYFGFYGGLSLIDYRGLGSMGINSVVAEAELGYGFTFSFVTIRPLLGIGAGFSDGPTCTSTVAPGATQSWQGFAGTTTGAGSTGTFILQPGALVQLGFGHVIFEVAVSAFIPFVLGPSASIEVDGQVGARF
jgi:hypothetical protein